MLLFYCQSDVFLLPLPISAEDSSEIQFGPVVKSTPTIFVQVLDVTAHPEELLEQLFKFSIGIAAMLFLVICSFAVVMSWCERRVSEKSFTQRLYDGTWTIVEMLIGQAYATPVTLAGRTLATMTLIGILFWLQLWQGEMKTDLTGYDTSRVAYTFDDLIRLNRTPILNSFDPSTHLVTNEAIMRPNSTIGKIWARAEIITPDHPFVASYNDWESGNYLANIPPQKEARRYAAITSMDVYSFLIEAVCFFTPKYEYLMGKEMILENLLSPWYNLHLSNGYKQILDPRFVTIREMGLMKYFLKQVVDSIPRQMKEFFPMAERMTNRKFLTINDYLQRKYDEDPPAGYLRMRQMRNTFRLMSACSFLAVIVLLLERAGMMRQFVAATTQRYKNRLTSLVAVVKTKQLFVQRAKKRMILIRRNKVADAGAMTAKMERNVIQLPSLDTASPKSNKSIRLTTRRMSAVSFESQV